MGRRVTWKSGGETHLAAHQDIPEEEEGMLRGMARVVDNAFTEKLLRERSGKLVCGQQLGPWSAGHCRTSPAPSTGQGGQVPGLGPLHIILYNQQPSLPTNGDGV